MTSSPRPDPAYQRRRAEREQEFRAQMRARNRAQVPNQVLFARAVREHLDAKGTIRFLRWMESVPPDEGGGGGGGGSCG
jgi:hypothetical protein